MIRTNSLTFQFGSDKKFAFPNIELADNDDLLIIGPSGIGKTTLLHLLAGLRKPQSGNIYVNETDLTTLRASRLDRFRGRNIGLIFQRPHFISALSLMENLLLVQHLAGLKINKKRIREITSHLGIESKLGENPRLFSQGEQQRAAIAIAILNRPKVIFADEPTSSLDDINCEKVTGLLLQQAHETSAHLIVITHDLRLKDQFKNVISL